jgi:ABC-type cobalamin/Fe3+-siderophores transport system ATPase subunit
MSMQIINASFGYRKDKVIFDGIDMETAENGVLCILGRNGCGKTTMLKCLCGILRLNGGDIIIDARASSTWNGMR